jgi:hypothetical protein
MAAVCASPHPNDVGELHCRVFKVACLAWRDLVIDDYELRIRRLRIGLHLPGVRLRVGIFKAVASVRRYGFPALFRRG